MNNAPHDNLMATRGGVFGFHTAAIMRNAHRRRHYADRMLAMGTIASLSIAGSRHKAAHMRVLPDRERQVRLG
jgi:hypothetical protein